MYFDGSYTMKGAGAAVVLIPRKGDMVKYAIQIEFSATNNTSHPGRLLAHGKTSTKKVRLQQRQDDRIFGGSAKNGEIF
jgi:hypothetical protein